MNRYPLFLKLYIALSGTVFLLVGLLHLFRLVYQWPITVGTADIPMLLSYTGLPGSIGACVLAIWLFRRSSK